MIHRYHRDMSRLARDIASTLGTDPTSKTVTFAVKTFGYAAREITGEFVPYPFDVPIPVDSRIRRLTEAITDEDPRRFWDRAAREADLPPLHLDTLLWLSSSPHEAVLEELERCTPEVGELARIVRRLLGHP